ncbi:hypothetical protein BGX27_001333 [Mortierella sp. AM989]|nr:hypothetical protein BGX27_001333 [Mortierella sp. AM989]
MSVDNTTPTPVNSTRFICQESFFGNKTSTSTSCLRYSKVKHCIKEGNEKRLNFYCVDQNSISIGGSGPSPLPRNITMTVFMCTMESCPQEAPADNTTKPDDDKDKKKEKKENTTVSEGNNVGSPSDAIKSDKKMTLSGLFVLALMVSQLAMM